MVEKYALISVYDKTGVIDLAREFAKSGYTILSSGGTAKEIVQAGVPVTPVEKITGNPESFGGRMKTISFQLEGGLLYDRANPEHVRQATTLGVPQIDIVVCNFYPFEETIAQKEATFAQAVENIDVGGPTMVRAAAKNHRHVLVVTDPADYQQVTAAVRERTVSDDLRRGLAAKAFSLLSYYDAQVAAYLITDEFPDRLTVAAAKTLNLRYGDNPDQKGVLYLQPNTDSALADLQWLTGREPSATNITDIDAGIKSVRLFSEPAAVVIKHNTPCGIALGESAAEALARALEADPESAFGGVVVLNKSTGQEVAQVIEEFKKAGKGGMDIIAVPGIDEEALEMIKSLRKSTGVYTFGDLPRQSPAGKLMRWVDGGFIVQPENDPEASLDQWRVVTKIQPTEEQLELMKIGWKFIARIRSNTVAVVDAALPMTRGIGTGQTSRVLATRIALERAGNHTAGAILASDSFFPFPDSIQLAGERGIACVVQQGGSVNDQAAIEAANQLGIAMVMTGQRLFWH